MDPTREFLLGGLVDRLYIALRALRLVGAAVREWVSLISQCPAPAKTESAAASRGREDGDLATLGENCMIRMISVWSYVICILLADRE